VRKPGLGTSCATSACALTLPEIGVYQADRTDGGDSDVSVAEVRAKSFP
jgi:hypothetical protein